MRSPETGKQAMVYPETEVFEVKQARASGHAMPVVPEGQCVRQKELMKGLGIRRETVLSLEDQGLLARIEVPRPTGMPAIWYPKSQYDELLTQRMREKEGYFVGLRGLCLTIPAVQRDYGFDRDTLYGYEDDCPCLPGGKLVPEIIRFRSYHQIDLDHIRAARASAWDGCWNTPEGRRLNLKIASLRTGLSRRRLRQYIKRCILLPEGKLPSERLRPPQGKKEHAVFEADLDRLMQAIAAAVNAGSLADKWSTVAEIFERHRIVGIKDRVAVNQLLRELHSAGILSGITLPLKYMTGNGQIRQALVLDTDELAALIGQNSLVQMASRLRASADPSAAGVQSNGHASEVAGIVLRDPTKADNSGAQADPSPDRLQAPEATRPEPSTRKKRGGRPPESPHAEQIKRLCYVGYVNGDKLAQIRERLKRLYGEAAPKQDSNIRTLATRYAEANNLPLNRPERQKTL
jgi:hypothetical protein